MKTVKIFISSTFRDMHAERDVVIKRVLPKLREKAEEHLGVRIQEIDLRWGVTEEQAKRGEVLGLCLDGIEEAKPYFVSMIGARYGWLPAPPYVGRQEFNAVLGSPELSDDDRKLLRRAYNLADVNGRVYTLDVSISNEHKDRVQRILETAGLEDAGRSITEKEIRQALEETALPRFVDNLEHRITEQADMSTEEKELLRAFYVRVGGEPIWHLQPGATDEEAAGIRRALAHLKFRREYHRFVFLRNDSAKGFYEVDGKAVDAAYTDTDPAQSDKLAALKTWIADREAKLEAHATYPCTWTRDNAGKEEQGIYPVTGLQQFEDRVFTSLWSHMQNNPELRAEEEQPWKTDDWERLPDHEKRRREGLYREEQQQLKFIDSRTWNFRGRQELLEEIEHAMAENLKTPDSGCVMVVGEPGSGKSALLAQVHNRLLRPDEQSAIRIPQSEILLVPRFIGASARSTNPTQLLEDFCGILKQRFGIEDEIPTDPIKLETAFAQFLGKADKPVIIILDAINQLQKTGDARTMRWLPRTLPQNVCIVTSAVEDPRQQGKGYDIEQDTTALDAMRARRPKTVEIAVAKLSDGEKQEIITSYLRQYNKELDTKLLAEMTAKQESYNPLYLQCALEELRIVSRHEDLSRFVNNLPASTVAMFDAMLDRTENELARVFDENTPRLFPAFLTYLATGRNGMTEQDLRLLLGDWQQVKTRGEESVRLSEFHWGELRRSLRPYLFQRGEQWDFFHQQLKQAVGQRYLHTREKRRETHVSIASYLEVMGYEHVTTASDLPHHLCKVADGKQKDAPEWDKVADVLCDLEFIEAKVRAGMVYELQADYEAALDILPEAQEEREKERLRQERLDRYRDELVAYARAWSEWRDAKKEGKETKEPAIALPTIKCCKLWTEEEIDAWDQRVKNSPNRFDILQEFDSFVRAEAYSFKDRYQPYHCIQRAYNYMTDGLIFDRAERLVRGNPDRLRLLLLKSFCRPAFTRHRATVRTFEERGSKASMTADSRRVVSVDLSGFLKVWDVGSGKCMQSLLTRTDDADLTNAVCVTMNGQIALTASSRGKMRIFDINNGYLKNVLEGHHDSVEAIAVSPDGKRAVSGSKDETVRLWDLQEGKCQRVMEGHDEPVLWVAISSDGRFAVSGSDRAVKLWNLQNGRCKKIFGLQGDRVIASLCMSADFTKLAVADLSLKDDRTTFRLVNVANARIEKSFGRTEVGEEVTSIVFTADLAYAVTASGLHIENGYDQEIQEMIKVWNIEGGHCDRNLTTVGRTCGRSITLSAEGKFAVSVGNDGIKLWNLERAPTKNHANIYRNLDLCSISLHAEERQLASTHHPDRLKLWNIQNGNCEKTIGNLDLPAIITVDGQHLVCGVPESTFKMCKLESGNCVREMQCQWEGHSALAVSPKPIMSPAGRRLLCASPKMFVGLLDLENGTCEERFCTEELGITTALAMSPDARLAVSAHGKVSNEASGLAWNVIKIWFLGQGICNELLEPLPDDASFYEISLSTDGRKLVAGSASGLTIWDIRTGRMETTIKQGTNTWEDAVLAFTISADGTEAVTGGQFGEIRKWDIKNGRCLAVFRSGELEGMCGIQSHAVCGIAHGPNVLLFFEPFFSLDILPFCTPRRVWHFGNNGKPGQWDVNFTIGCPLCGNRSSVSDIVISTIHEIHNSHGITKNDSPCLKLPDEAWETPGLRGRCTSCGRELRFNPFIGNPDFE